MDAAAVSARVGRGERVRDAIVAVRRAADASGLEDGALLLLLVLCLKSPSEEDLDGTRCVLGREELMLKAEVDDSAARAAAVRPSVVLTIVLVE